MPNLIIAQAHATAASGTSGWTVIATFAAVVAAGAALVTVIYARRTVLDGKSAHSEEMDQRSRALVAEIRLQRLVHVSRIADVMIAIARAAYDERLVPPVPGASSQRQSMIPSLQAQLRAELAAFRALGGPDLPSSDELADKAYGDVEDEPYQTARPDAMRKLAGQGLAELQQVADSDDRLKVTLDEQLRLANLDHSSDHAHRRFKVLRLWGRGS